MYPPSGLRTFFKWLVEMVSAKEDHIVESVKKAVGLLGLANEKPEDRERVELRELQVRQALHVHGKVVDGKVTNAQAKGELEKCKGILDETKDYLLNNPVEPVYYVRDRLSEITLVPGAAKGSFLVPHAGGPERAKIEVGD